MNLWVRNQDKTILQKVDNLLISDGNNAEETFNIYTNSLPAQNVLGRYKTKERAKKVLNEIIEIFTLKQFNGKKLSKKQYDMIIKAMQFNIYEMPED